MSERGLVCFDMDRVLIDHLSTWQWVYDKLGISNEEAFNLYNQGLLNEWDWIILDIALIRSAVDGDLLDEDLRGWLLDCPRMEGWRECIQTLLDDGHEVAIISGGMQHSARMIAAQFPSSSQWRRRWGGIDRNTAAGIGGKDSRLHVFCNGWTSTPDGRIPDTGRYQVQMHAKGAIVKMLQRRLGISKQHTASVGDSAGDIDMFHESGFSITFNPWDERPKEHSTLTIEEKNLNIVLSEIRRYFRE